jgi:predicted phage terminase large subunit-like protein
MPFPKQVKMVKKLYHRWKPELIGIESNNYQLALKQQVLDETILPIKEVISIKNKVERIKVGSVNYENGLVYVPIDHPEYNNFMEEYRRFYDKGSHDDMLDSTDITMKLILGINKGVPFTRNLRSNINAR